MGNEWCLCGGGVGDRIVFLVFFEGFDVILEGVYLAVMRSKWNKMGAAAFS